MSDESGEWNYRWVNLEKAEWSESGQICGGSDVRVTEPRKGHWIVVLLP